MSLLKEILTIESSFKYVIINGQNTLREDLKKYPPFDPSRPYEEKNAYVNRANVAGIMLMQEVNLPALAEIYHKRLLDDIQNYEKQTNTKFNKGIVYSNLGVSIASRGDIDQGFAYILKAHEEDAPFHMEGHEPAFLGSPLYQQFEERVTTFIGESDNIHRRECSNSGGNQHF